MVNETIEDEDLLSAWVIHFSLAGCLTSVLREKLKKPSNIYFWESVTFDESQQFDLIYFLTQTFLSEDIETLGHIILEPEEIHELVQKMASVRKNESGDFNEANYRTEINRQPFIRCNFENQKCVSFELLVTDLFDPDHTLRGLLRDLQAFFNTRNVARGIEVRDSSCVTSYNVTKCTRDKDDMSDTVTPTSQGSKQTRRKGTRNCRPTFAAKNTPTTLSSSKSPRKSTKKNPSQTTQKKSRKRGISSRDRKSFYEEILKMRKIETYFKPIPRKVKEKVNDIQDKKANGRSSLNSVEIYTVEDDSDSSIELIENLFHRDHARVETHDSITELIDSLPEDCITLNDKTGTSITTPIQGEALDINICMTKANLPHHHATQATQMSALKDNCTEICHVEAAENTDISDSENNTTLYHYDKNVFQLDATAKEIIREWCGGDTFLTQDSPGSSGEVMEQDKTTDKDNDNGVNEHRSWNRNNDKFDDDDDDDDDDDNNGVMNGALYCNGHNRNNNTSDDDSDDDDDNDDDDDSDEDNDDDDDDDDDDESDADDDSDDDDDDIESDDANDEDYVYDSKDESDSESDKDCKKNSNKFKYMLSPRNVQRKRFQRKKRW